MTLTTTKGIVAEKKSAVYYYTIYRNGQQRIGTVTSEQDLAKEKISCIAVLDKQNEEKKKVIDFDSFEEMKEYCQKKFGKSECALCQYGSRISYLLLEEDKQIATLSIDKDEEKKESTFSISFIQERDPRSNKIISGIIKELSKVTPKVYLRIHSEEGEQVQRVH